MRSAWGWWGAVLVVAPLVLVADPGRAEAQAVAFAPGIATIPDGVQMTAVPAVSADRRYVRLSVNPSFQTVEGFTNFAIPFAVSGMGSGTGAAGGAAALGGAGFPGAGGFRSVGVPMGMNGPVGGGYAAGSQALASGYPTADESSGSSMDDGSWSPVSPRTRAARSRSARAKKATTAAAKGR